MSYENMILKCGCCGAFMTEYEKPKCHKPICKKCCKKCRKAGIGCMNDLRRYDEQLFKIDFS